jgi:ribosomal protein S18 acetylase RimI-like enzyme
VEKSSDVTIRRAVALDAAVVAELRFALRAETQSVREPRQAFVPRCSAWMAERLAAEGGAWSAWVAVAGSAIVAQLWLEVFEKIPNPQDDTTAHAYISSVYVVPEWRRKRIGDRLLTAALASLQGVRVGSCILWATQGSRSLYARQHFEPPRELLERRL